MKNNASIICFKNIFLNIRKNIKEDNISECAAEAAFFTIISLIPFFTLFINLIKLTNIQKETIYLVFKNFIPLSLQNDIFKLIEESYFKSIKFISFSILILFWGIGKGFYVLSKGIKKIYKIDIQSNILLRIGGSIYTVLLIVLIIVLLFFTILGRNIYIFLMNMIPHISKCIFIIYKCRILFFILLLIIAFYLLYKMILNKKSNEFSHIYGAIFSAVLWQITIYIISIYIKISKRIYQYLW